MTGKMAGRSTLQDLVRGAMVKSAERVRISEEARTQEDKLTGVKTASAAPTGNTKLASAQAVEKLASALDFIAEQFDKEASMGGAYSLSGSTAATAPPPGVSASEVGGHPAYTSGHGVNTVPMHPGVQKAMPQEQSPTQLDNTIDRAPGGKEKMVQKNASKSVLELIREKQAASEKAEKEEGEGIEEAKKGVEKAEAAHKNEPENKSASALVEYMLAKTKKAEDAINPAHISAGAAVAPETSQSGESGGNPVGGAPQGPTGLVGSNESATNYTRGQAYANRKQDMGKYLNEPMQSAAHDTVLRDAFERTSQAGPKLAAAEGAQKTASASVQTAAARALLTNLAKTAEAEANKNTGGAAA